MRFVIVSLLFMFWGFYELSGGRDFVPASKRDGAVASAEASTIPEDSQTEVVARSATTPVVDLDIARVSKPAAADTAPEAGEAKIIKASANVSDDAPVDRNVGEGTLKVMKVRSAAPAPEPKPAVRDTDAMVAAAVARISERAPADLRLVTGSSVNMRNGPGTRYNVLDRLVEGDKVEVLQDPGNGWVKLRAEQSGRIGWMADFLLAKAD